MEQSPTTSRPTKDFISPKKRKIVHLTHNEKMMIINVYKYIQESWPADKYMSKTEMKQKTANILGISQVSVYRVLKEYTKTNTVKPPARPKKNYTVIESTDSYDKARIRKIVHGFYFKNEIPTLNKVLQAVNYDAALPNFSRTTLWRMLKHLKFKYQKNKRDRALIERNDIVLWRIKYLRTIKKHRQEGRPIYYLDETWINAEHTVNKAYEDTTLKSSTQAFLEGLSTDAKNSTSTSAELIVGHIGSDKGFLPDSQWIFRCKTTGGYQESINADNFENWFMNVLPRLEPNAVVIMDNASYHSRRKEKVPITSWQKKYIQEWLTKKGIIFENTETKAELLLRVKNVKNGYMSYVVDEMAKAAGVEVLRLPPYHCELNPIELIWVDIKGHVSKNNTTFKFNDVKKLLEEGLSSVDETKWRKFIEQIVKEEEKLNSLDHIVDKTVHVTDSSSSSENDSELDDD